MDWKAFWSGIRDGFVLPVTFVVWLWGKINGWKTRLIMLIGALLQLASITDPNLIATYLKLDRQETAGLVLLFFFLGWLAREVANKPGVIAKMLNKSE